MNNEIIPILILWIPAILISIAFSIYGYLQKEKELFKTGLQVLAVALTPFGMMMTVIAIIAGITYALNEMFNYFFNKITKNFNN